MFTAPLFCLPPSPLFPQVATLVVDVHGLLVYASDDARVMQGCAHFRKEVRALRAQPGLGTRQTLQPPLPTALTARVSAYPRCSGTSATRLQTAHSGSALT